MFIFILGPAIVGISSALFSLTMGGSFVIVAMAAAEWQRRRGYKNHEGTFTERENDVYYGVRMDKDSPHDLSYSLGLLAAIFPEEFKNFLNKKFDFTKTEGKQLRLMIQPIQQGVAELDEILGLYEEDKDNDEIKQAVLDTKAKLKLQILPLVFFLDEFPKHRVKDIPSA